MKPMFEKNKRLSKKNDDLLQTFQRMEEKLKNLSRENAEMVRKHFIKKGTQIEHKGLEHFRCRSRRSSGVHEGMDVDLALCNAQKY